MNITLRQLRYFDALARAGHFGHAAEMCSVTQPALSMQIKDLEDALGDALFERTARQIALTAFGEQALIRARHILRAVDELGDFARASRDQLAGRFRLGMIPTIAPYLLPTILKAISHHFPTIDVHVRETLTKTLIHELIDGRLDTAIVALPVSEPTLVERALFSEDFLLVRALNDEGLPLPSRDKLRDMRLLLLEEGHCFRDQALSFCNSRLTSPRDVLDASSLSTLVQMVSAGLGVTFIPEMAVALETRTAAVSVARFKPPQPSRTIGMIWRKTSPLAKQLHQLADVLQAASLELRAMTDVTSVPRNKRR